MTPRFLPFSVGRPWHLVGRLAGRQRGVSIIGAVFLLLLMSLLAALTSLPAQALDLGNLAGGLIELTKAATLTDSDAKALAFEASRYQDSKHQVAPATHPYAQRLSRMVRGLQQEDGLALNFKVYLTPELNAFAMADGTVRVYSGLLDKMQDDEVRFVIGHEVGHVKLGHSKKAMQVAYSAAAAHTAAGAAGESDQLHGCCFLL